MAKLYSSKHIISVLLDHGFREVGQKGSHKKLTHGQFVVIVPHPKKEIPIGTFLSIVRQSGLDRSAFL